MRVPGFKSAGASGPATSTRPERSSSGMYGRERKGRDGTILMRCAQDGVSAECDILIKRLDLVGGGGFGKFDSSLSAIEGGPRVRYVQARIIAN
jgi:hypothetical protein